MNAKEFVTVLEKFDHIGLTAPAGADGDSVGTQSAVRELLLQIAPQKRIRIINEEPCPQRYLFLPQSKYFEVSRDLVANMADAPQVMICVDGGANRIGEATTQLWDAAKTRGQIDHHAIGKQEGYDFRLYDPQAAATTEIVYRAVLELGLKLTPSVAQAIYMGLIFDTGLFKHSNTKPETLQIAAELLRTGFNHTETAEKGMLIRSSGALKMLRAVMNSATFDVGGRYPWGILRYNDFQAAGGDSDDREGIIDMLFLTRQCEIAAFYFEMKPNDWKISFRSRGHDVASLAQSLNEQGGGHKQAAGCSLKGEESEVLEKCHRAIRLVLES